MHPEESGGDLLALTQVAVAVALAFVVWRASDRSQSFRRFVGFIVPPARAVLAALALAVPFAALTWASQAFVPEVAQVLRHERSALRPIAAATSLTHAVAITLLYGCLQTALSEEILFRGLVAKRLAARLPPKAANLLQASVFASAHTALLIRSGVEAGLSAHALAFAAPFAMSLVCPLVNERLGNGSIAPSWILHAAVNLTAGLTFYTLL